MGLFDNLFGKKSNNKKSSNQIQSGNKEKHPYEFEGKGTDNQNIINIYGMLTERLNQWRQRYSKQEYPERVIMNVIYQSLQLRELWNVLDSFFGQSRFQDINEAVKHVNNISASNSELIHPKVNNFFSSGGTIGNFNIDHAIEDIYQCKTGSLSALNRIEKTYKWYSGAFELGVLFCSLGLVGFSKNDALQKLLTISLNLDVNIFSNAQIIFGNNMSLMFGLESKKETVIEQPNIRNESDYNLNKVKKFMKMAEIYVKNDINITFHNVRVISPPLVSEFKNSNPSQEQFDICIDDTDENPTVIYYNNQFRLNPGDLNKDIFLCVVGVKKDEDNWLLDDNGTPVYDQFDFDDYLYSQLGRQIGVIGAYTDNGVRYKEYSWIIGENRELR